MKKRLSLFALITALVLLLSACGGQTVTTTTTAPAATTTKAAGTTTTTAATTTQEPELEPVTITVITAYSPSEPKWEDSVIGKRVLEDLKVTLEIEYIITDAQTKESVLLASGVYPDVISASINSQAWIDQGAVIPLEDLYATHAPRLQAWYDRAGQDIMKEWSSEDGHTYKLPVTGQVAWNDGFNPGSGFMIQAKVLEEAGWPEVKTIDQYWALIEEYVAKNPTIDGKPTIGYTVRNQSWQFDSISDNPTQLLFGFHDDGGFLNEKQPDGTYKAKVVSGSDYERQYLRFMTEIFEKGLVDPEGFVEDGEQWKAKMSSGRVIGYFGWWYEMGAINQALRDQGMADREFVMFPLVWETGIQEKWYALAENSVATGIMISQSCEKPERVMQFMDGLADEEMIKLIVWGEQGVDYEVDSAGKMFLTDEQIAARRNPELSKPRGLENALVVFPGLGSDHTFADKNPYSPKLLPAYFRAVLSETMLKYLNAYGYDAPGSAYKLFKTDYGFTWSIPVPGDSDAGLAAAQLDALQREMQPKILMGGVGNFDTLYAEYLAKLDKINLEAYHDYLTQEINKRIADRSN